VTPVEAIVFKKGWGRCKKQALPWPATASTTVLLLTDMVVNISVLSPARAG